MNDNISLSIRVLDQVCNECGTPLVWTAIWQGVDCVVCTRRDRDGRDTALEKELAARAQEIENVRKVLNGDLKIASERVLTLELENAALRQQTQENNNLNLTAEEAKVITEFLSNQWISHILRSSGMVNIKD